MPEQSRCFVLNGSESEVPEVLTTRNFEIQVKSVKTGSVRSEGRAAEGCRFDSSSQALNPKLSTDLVGE